MTATILRALPARAAAVLAAAVLAASTPGAAPAAQAGASSRAAEPAATARAKGVLRVRSAYSFAQTVTRLKADIAAKGIRFFTDIDQAQLGAGAKINLPPSRLLIFGNPPLGVQFLTANRLAGLDWPVRMLVVQDPDRSVWVAWTDFSYIADRYSLHDRDAALAMASDVSASIASSVARRSPAR